MALKFKKHDHVVVITGSNKGKTGNIIEIDNDRALVSNINLFSVRKKKSSEGNLKNKVNKKEASIHISNLAHLENGKPVKISFKIESADKKNFSSKIRISKKTGKSID